MQPYLPDRACDPPRSQLLLELDLPMMSSMGSAAAPPLSGPGGGGNAGGGAGGGGGSASALDLALPEVIKEMGYQFTARQETCRNHLMRLGGAETMTASTVARYIENLRSHFTVVD